MIMRKIYLLSFFILMLTEVFCQIDWIKHGSKPVLPRSKEVTEWDYFTAADPSVIKDGDTLKIWYTGAGPTSTDTVTRLRIGYAWSIDGITWNKHPQNPVLESSPATWDSIGLETVTVLKDETALPPERYKMWYAGSDDPIYGLYKIGYAYSPDGVNWTKHPDPVLLKGDDDTWESGGPEGPTVILFDDTLRMWYAGYDSVYNGERTDFSCSIGYAWSLDGKLWNKYPNNPIMTIGDEETWDAANIQDPFVLRNEDTYHMWYSGFSEWIFDGLGQYQIGYAYSSDGINWTKSSANPVLKYGSNNDWDKKLAGFPTIILENSTLHMWYTGIDTLPIPEWPAPYYWDIGYARSSMESVGMILYEKHKAALKIYPTPAVNRVTLEISDTGFNPFILWLYDIHGNCVREQKDLTSDLIMIEKNNLANGLYIVKLSSNEGKYLTGKVFFLDKR